MKKIWRNSVGKLMHISVRTYMILFSSLLIAAVIISISLFSYSNVMEEVMDNVDRVDQQNVAQMARKLDYSINEIISVIDALVNRKELLDKLNLLQPTTDVYRQIEYEIIIRKMLSDMIGANTFLDGIGVFKDGYSIYSGGGVAVPYQHVLNHPSLVDLTENMQVVDIQASNTGIQFGYDGTDRSILNGVYFARTIVDEQGAVWYLIAKSKFNWLSKLFANSGSVLVTAADRIIWFSDPSMESMLPAVQSQLIGNSGSFRQQIDHADLFFSYQRIGQNNWTVVYCNNLQSAVRGIRYFRFVLMAVSLICLAIGVILILLFSRSITRSIKTLQGTIERYKTDPQSLYINRHAKRYSIQTVLFSYFIILIAVPLSIYITVFYLLSASLINHEIMKSVQATIDQTAENVDLFVQTNERISVRIITDPYTQGYLTKTSGSVTDDMLYQIIEDNLSFEQKIFETNLYNDHGKLLFSTSYFNRKYASSANLYESALQSIGNAVWVGYGIDPYKRHVVNLTRKVYATDGKIVNLGFLSMTYLESYLQDLYRDITIGISNILIVETNGTIVSSKYKNMIGESYDILAINELDLHALLWPKDLNITEQRVLVASCEHIPWMVIAEIDPTLLSGSNRTLISKSLSVGLIILFTSILIAFLLVHLLTKPIDKLREAVTQYEPGKNEITVNKKQNYINEIEELGSTFNEMSRHINNLIETVYVSQIKAVEMEHEKKSADLIALQSQINPHFLYNTLESIKWMVKSGKIQQADKMISHLGELFTLGVGNASQLFTLEEEIQCAQVYIEIQKIRLDGKVSFHWSIDEKMRQEIKVPKLVLQPLIENAIKHGLQQSMDGGHVSIQCHPLDAERAVITVMDDGMGVTHEKLEEIQFSLSAKDLGGHNIGIFNVHKRIQLFFGADYGLSFDSHPLTGTIVRLTVPRQTIQPDTPD